MLLAIAMAPPNSLLDSLGVPRQVVVDDQRAELEIDPLRGGLGSDENLSLVPEVLYQTQALVGQPGATEPTQRRIHALPFLVDAVYVRARIRTIEQNDSPSVAVRL